MNPISFNRAPVSLSNPKPQPGVARFGAIAKLKVDTGVNVVDQIISNSVQQLLQVAYHEISQNGNVTAFSNRICPYFLLFSAADATTIAKPNGQVLMFTGEHSKLLAAATLAREKLTSFLKKITTYEALQKTMTEGGAPPEVRNKFTPQLTEYLQQAMVEKGIDCLNDLISSAAGAGRFLEVFEGGSKRDAKGTYLPIEKPEWIQSLEAELATEEKASK